MNNVPKELSDTESQKPRKRMRESNEPFPPNRRMLLKDVPMSIWEEEGREIMAIHGLLDSQVTSIIQQLKQASHEQDTSSDNVQILENVIGECKNQLIAIAQAGIGKLQLCSDKEDQGGAESGASF